MRRLLVLLPAGGPPKGYLVAAVSRAASTGSGIVGLYLKDEVWRSISSADWLSTGPSRASFDEYMQGVLVSEGERMSEELRALSEEAGVPYSFETAEGDPKAPLAGRARALGIEEVFWPGQRA